MTERGRPVRAGRALHSHKFDIKYLSDSMLTIALRVFLFLSPDINKGRQIIISF